MRVQIMFASAVLAGVASAGPYPVVDTNQQHCYGLSGAVAFPQAGQPYYGQDAQYSANPPSYRDNGDGTVTDKVTGLMWTQTPAARKTYPQAVKGAAACKVGGYSDWRLPTIKELYSLIQFSGIDPDPMSKSTSGLRPFIDSTVFKFEYGDPARRERIIDAQYVSSTRYVSTTMEGAATVFGVNFADGRIKGYGLKSPRSGAKTFFVLYVRGNPDYGENKFRDNLNGTVTDQATGLTWMKPDSGEGMDWPTALAYAENLTFAGHSDWRLPNAKELQSIVDYTRSPDTTGTAPIDPVFEVSPILNEAGQRDFANYWTSTTHVGSRSTAAAAYVAFGRSLGHMKNRRTGIGRWLDVHGAGAQRSDPKVGDTGKFPTGRGPQGDAIRIRNMVRCVRGGDVREVAVGPKIESEATQQPPRPQSDRNGATTAPNRRGPGAAHFVRRLDKDGDGKVSRSEFDGPANHFSVLDKDGDGYLSATEAPTGPPRRPTRSRQGR